MTAAVIRLLAQESESTGSELPVDPLVVGIGSFVLLCALLLVTMAFGKDR